MSPAIASSLGIVAYLALFSTVGIVFLFANLLLGRFLRPQNPFQEKLEIYECGEPTIGSSFVQFDLRFYVVALLFIIFDVEVAFFFPWATVFGKASNLMREDVAVVQRSTDGSLQLTDNMKLAYQELGVRNPTVPTTVPATLNTKANVSSDPAEQAEKIVHAGFQQLAWLTIVDIIAFFAVLLVGFAYVWKRGDLDWVRAVGKERALQQAKEHSPDLLEEEQFLSA